MGDIQSKEALVLEQAPPQFHFQQEGQQGVEPNSLDLGTSEAVLTGYSKALP